MGMKDQFQDKSQEWQDQAKKKMGEAGRSAGRDEDSERSAGREEEPERRQPEDQDFDA